ncbi:MAG: uroporphyrinogen-III synthase [Qipengyuania sp.]|jgi:uroporphyrinogen-III synthase|nr:uroporphyrinogen-III synthase [Qipengyuania sp.]
MTRPLALLRPEPGWSASAAAAREAGLEAIGHPLFAGEPIGWQPPAGDFDGLLVGSAAVFRHGGPQLAGLRTLPVQAVGESTARAARAAGFDVERIGVGGLQTLLDASAGQTRRFLRLAGEERVALTPRPGQSVSECAVYRMVARPIEPLFAAALSERRPLVLLHSAAAARQFAREVDRLAIGRGALPLLALGPRVATAAGPSWEALHLAESPSDAALLAKAAALCK